MSHWIENEQARKKFWVEARKLGDEDAIHDRFQVDSMKSYKGTYEGALTELKRWADELLTATCQQLPEAPVVAWTTMQSPAGFVWHITLRAGLPPELARATLTQTREQMELFEAGAKAHNWYPVANGRDTVLSPEAAKPATAPPTASQPPVAGNGGNGAGKTFEAAHLVGSIADGKEYWKVKGGKFSQYGVTIWPEVLEDAGFDLNLLSPTEQYDLAGYTAHYIENDKGNPQKVTKLAKAA